jgi:endonuclease/exonuclease/phosphatase family metal-dependent hydrolase
MTQLTVMSYNVLSLRRGTALVADVIRACDPDVVCVQEAPRFLFWRRKCRDLAERSGLRIVTGGRPAGAMLLLARPSLRVVARRDVKLPWHPPKHRRGLAIGTFDVGGREVVVASAHLSLDPAERLRQGRQVLDVLAAFAAPVVLAGDMNDNAGDATWALLAGTLTDAWAAAPVGDGLTSTAAHPHKRIDGVFVDRRLRVVSCGVPDVPGLVEASDHRPLVAVIETDG